jgi:hypothetical protein
VRYANVSTKQVQQLQIRRQVPRKDRPAPPAPLYTGVVACLFMHGLLYQVMWMCVCRAMSTLSRVSHACLSHAWALLGPPS